MYKYHNLIIGFGKYGESWLSSNLVTLLRNALVCPDKACLVFPCRVVFDFDKYLVTAFVVI